MNKVVLVLLVCLAGYFSRARLATLTLAPKPMARDVSFLDVSLEQRTIASVGKPAVVGYWIDNCPYSARTLRVMRAVRSRFADDQVDVYGLYLNVRADRDIVSLAGDGSLLLAGVQQSRTSWTAFNETFPIGLPGRDIFVTDGRGHYYRIDASDRDVKEDRLVTQVAQVLEAKVLAAR